MNTSVPQNVPALFSNAAWQSCFEAFITSLKSPRTQAFYANILHRFFQNRDPSTITKADIEAFLSADCASSTIITRTSCIRSFYKFASTYMVNGKKPLFKSGNPCDGIQHRNLPTSSPKARLTIPTGSRLPPRVHIDYKDENSSQNSDGSLEHGRKETTDVLTHRRREVLAIILNDYLGDVPATALAPYLAGNPLIVEGGPFLFAANKVMPHPLGQESLKRLIAYIEHIGNNEHVWCSAYWRIANELASRLSEEKQPATLTGYH